MASLLVRTGRFMFFALIIVQGISLASYPARYEHNANAGFYGLTALYLPALLLWLRIIWDEESLPWLFVVWVLYVWVALVPLIGAIFGRIEDDIDKETFFGPNVLKMTLCISPLLLLLLLNTAVDSVDYRELVLKLSLQIALDLFDGVEMLEVILEENEFSHGIPKSFEKAMIAFVCISFLVSPLQLAENKLRRHSGMGDWDVFTCTAVFRIIVQILCVNGVFLVLRLVLVFDYGKDASIFIAKNGIMLIFSSLELCSIFGCCGYE
ncbi:uncharacterized protein LOC144661010 [Oculina patagonica]